MKQIRTSDRDSVIEQLEKTYPDFKLCSYEHLGMMNKQLEMDKNTSRFWNNRSSEVLKSIKEMNNVMHYFPDTYFEKIIADREFAMFFHSQYMLYLNKQVKKKKADPDKVALMIKLYSNFLQIGMQGILQQMPSEFTHILEPKVQEIMELMNAIKQYTKAVAPKKAQVMDFPFSQF